MYYIIGFLYYYNFVILIRGNFNFENKSNGHFIFNFVLNLKLLYALPDETVKFRFIRLYGNIVIVFILSD